MGKSGSAFPAGSLQGIAGPHLFSVAAWESKHILSDGWHALRFGRAITSAQEDTYIVNKYEDLRVEISRLEGALVRGTADMGDERERDLRARLESLRAEKKELDTKVKFVLVGQISVLLDSEGLSYHLPFFKNTSVLFPAVAYSPSELPQLLIVSPRDRIEMTESMLLVPEMSGMEIASVEKRVETLDVSALVERVGGIATYPSLLSEETELPNLVETIAHEWFHQYLFFHPLGRSYWRDYQMTIINETVADLGGREIALGVLERYYPEAAKKMRAPSPGSVERGTDFNKEMRRVRLRVDELLAEGKIDEAERFMEESRIDLAAKGYFIRRINQAYFAFHGSYGEGPAATSPMGPLLRRLRDRSGSLGNFIRLVSGISSSEELTQLSR